MLIDGYNLLRAIQNTYEEMAGIDEIALCTVLSVYLKKIKKRGCIVFDGLGPPDKTALNNFRNPQIIFSGSALEADDIIEKLILEHTAPKRLVVVSTDRRIKAAARKRKAKSINSNEFWAEVIKCIEKKQKHIPEPKEKLTGLTNSEAELWLKEFGLDK